MKYPQLRDYDYLSPSFGRFCWLADLAVWWKKRRHLTVVVELAPEPEADAFTQSLEHFNNQIRTFPHVLEPYVILLGQAETQDEQQKIMWRSLRETFRQRFPLRPSAVHDGSAHYGTAKEKT